MNAPHNNSKRRRQDLALKRSERDLERNRCWDELNQMYASCAGMLYQHRALAELATQRDLLPYLKDTQTLVTQIRSLAEDLKQLNIELGLLYAQHKDKQGGAGDERDVIESIKVAEQYYLFMERHNGVVLPTVYHILEVFTQAELARDAALAASGATVAATEAAQSSADTGPIDVPHREMPAQPLIGDPASVTVH